MLKPGNSKKRRKWGITLVKIFGTALLLFLVLRQVDWSQLAGVVSGTHFVWLPATFACVLGRTAILALRWQLLLGYQDVVVSYRSSLVTYAIATFFNLATPANLGGDAYRVSAVRSQKGIAIPSATVLLEKILGLAALLGLLGSGIILYRNLPPVEVVATVWVTTCAIVLVALPAVSMGSKRFPFIQNTLNRKLGLKASFQSLTLAQVVLTLLLSLVAHLAVISGHYFVIRALSLGQQIPLTFLLFAVPATLFLVMLPVSFQGIGVNENLYALFFSAFSVPVETSLAFSWLFLLAGQVSMGLLGALVFIRRNKGLDPESGEKHTHRPAQH